MTSSSDQIELFLTQVATLEEEVLLARVAALYDALSSVGFEVFNTMWASLIQTLCNKAVDFDVITTRRKESEQERASTLDLNIYTRALFALADVAPGAFLASLGIVLANEPASADIVRYMAEDCVERISQHLEEIRNEDDGELVEVVDVVSQVDVLQQLQRMITKATDATVITGVMVAVIRDFVTEHAEQFRNDMQQTPRNLLMQYWRTLLLVFSNLANQVEMSMSAGDAKTAVIEILIDTVTSIARIIPNVIVTAIGESARLLGPQLVSNNSYVVTTMFDAAANMLLLELGIVREIEKLEAQADEESSDPA
jgi:hypothetical protein